MKKLSICAIAVLLLLILASCGEAVTPVAYTRFETTGEQFVYYSSVMVLDQMTVYKNYAACENKEGADITFNFIRCLGRDELNEVPYILVDVSYKEVSMDVTVMKDSPMYGASKEFYLNGTKLVPSQKIDEDEYNFVMFCFRDVDFVRTNPHGRIDDTKVNVIEYK